MSLDAELLTCARYREIKMYLRSTPYTAEDVYTRILQITSINHYVNVDQREEYEHESFRRLIVGYVIDPSQDIVSRL